jgi:peptide/nickel transport system substrate-binding protein
MLQELVRAGKLPPIDQRLPKEPFVIGPGVLLPQEHLNFKVGRYGGTMRLVHQTPGWEPSVFIQSNEPLLLAPGLTTDSIKGNVLRDYTVSPDGSTFTFYMREGLKWSDGTPVTTEDVRFTYEDFLLNKDITPVFPEWMKTGAKGTGDPMKLEIIDRYTFRVSFGGPYGAFPVHLHISGWKGYTELLKPAHFLKQFHPKYTPMDKLEPMIQKAGLAKGEWAAFFLQKDVRNWDLTRPKAQGFPVLYPWVMVETTPTSISFERNPYYFKVDTAGNQLPYIDRLRSQLVADAETAKLKILAGETDHSYEYGVLSELPLYKENAAKGGYNITLFDLHRTAADVQLNMTHPDPVWRQVVRDVRFRRALSMGVDRDEIVDAVYFGYAAPSKSVPGYDSARANQLLDEMGLDKRDSEGFRLGPDGKRFVIPIEHHVPFKELQATAELVADHWTNKLGIQTTTKVLEAGLRATRRSANELKATVAWHHWTLWYLFAAFYTGDENIGVLWNQWRTSGGKAGEEPPAEAKEFFDLIAQTMTALPQDRARVLSELRQNVYDNVWWIITVEDVKYAVMTSKKLQNVASKGFGIAAQFAGEQYFFGQ